MPTETRDDRRRDSTYCKGNEENQGQMQYLQRGHEFDGGKMIQNEIKKALMKNIAERLQNVPKLIVDNLEELDLKTMKLRDTIILDYRIKVEFEEIPMENRIKLILTVNQLAGVPKNQPTMAQVIIENILANFSSKQRVDDK